MREIKFRAWDKNLNSSGGMIWNAAILNGKYFDIFEMETRDYPLMQFTGRKDKNGDEIYEGDILELINEDGEKIKAVCKFGNRRLTTEAGITIDVQCFYFEVGGQKTNPVVNNYLGKHDLEIMEVVSNVFEYLGLSEK